MPAPLQHPEILIQSRRGGTVESLHRAVAALAGPDGEIVERWGDPGMVTYWRSSAKPLQAQAWVADGTVDQFGWGAEELAIMSASHDGLDFQAGLVRRMLADIGTIDNVPAFIDEVKMRREWVEAHVYAGAHHSFDALGLPVRYLDGVGNRSKPGGCCGAHYGANEAAWNAFVGDVRAFLATRLAR